MRARAGYRGDKRTARSSSCVGCSSVTTPSCITTTRSVSDDDLVEPVRDVDNRVPAFAELAHDAVELRRSLRSSTRRSARRERGRARRDRAHGRSSPGAARRPSSRLDVRARIDPRVEIVEHRLDTRVQLRARDQQSQAARISRADRDVLGDGELGEVARAPGERRRDRGGVRRCGP